MATLTNEGKATKVTTIEQPYQDDLFGDLGKYFDEWLKSLDNRRNSLASITSPTDEENPTGSFYLESTAGTHCEVSFEGVLQVEGHLAGNIRSFKGTLVMPEQGKIEADIEVGVALINGCVNGNISASERVVLQSQARVEGNIKTPSLSISDGAVFEGECYFRDEPELDQPAIADQEEFLETLVVA